MGSRLLSNGKVVDHFSSKVWTKVIKKRDAPTMATFYQEIVDEVGVAPNIVHVDQGSENKGELKDTVIQSGAKYVTSAVRHPQSNGAVERPNGILKPNISRTLTENPSMTYEGATSLVTTCHNSRCNTVTKFKPVDLFNIGLRAHPEYFRLNQVNLTSVMLAETVNAISNVKLNKSKRSEMDRKRREKKAPSEKSIVVGDEVWVKMKNPKGVNQQGKYRGRILERLSNGRVVVEFISDMGGPKGEKPCIRSPYTYLLSEVARVCHKLTAPTVNPAEILPNHSEVTLQLEPPETAPLTIVVTNHDTPIISRKGIKRKRRDSSNREKRRRVETQT